uniref:Uncharacterized protein n=1 Tax=Avena sativa TaxID=4498 RepID=A0ACD5WU98_AVESA
MSFRICYPEREKGTGPHLLATIDLLLDNKFSINLRREFSCVMENKEAAPAAATAAQENKEAASCFKRTVPEDATFVEAAKEQLKQFTEAPMEEHWSCIKNKVRSVFGEPSAIFGGFGKDDSSKTAPPSVESQ